MGTSGFPGAGIGKRSRLDLRFDIFRSDLDSLAQPLDSFQRFPIYPALVCMAGMIVGLTKFMNPCRLCCKR